MGCSISIFDDSVGPVFFSSSQVTALAAVQKLEGKGNIMGISMGSSEGAGYANAEGHLSTARSLGK